MSKYGAVLIEKYIPEITFYNSTFITGFLMIGFNNLTMLSFYSLKFVIPTLANPLNCLHFCEWLA